MTHDDTKGAPVVDWALFLMLGWAGLSALWNVAGVVLISQGKSALGPTASLGAAAALVVFIAALLWAVKKSPAVMVVLAAIAGLGALAAMWTVISGMPSMWPSPLWRFAGGAINVLGVVGAAGCVGRSCWNA